jgi:hypothetical protein
MAQVIRLADEWLPALFAPFDADLEVCVIDYEGISHALALPCRRDRNGWFDSSTKTRLDIQPTHWRSWAAEH